MANWLVIVSILVFDLIAFALAITAEQRRSTASTVTNSKKEYTYCVYDSDISTGLGVGAFLSLLLSQLILMVASRCHCCGRALRASGPRACALILFLLCWMTFIIAEACLLAGSVRNAYHTRYPGIFGGEPPSCQTLRKGVFAAGAAFVFFTAIISEVYYLLYSKAKDGGAPYESAVGMSAYR